MTFLVLQLSSLCNEDDGFAVVVLHGKKTPFICRLVCRACENECYVTNEELNALPRMMRSPAGVECIRFGTKHGCIERSYIRRQAEAAYTKT
jgi:hypothetical protein